MVEGLCKHSLIFQTVHCCRMCEKLRVLISDFTALGRLPKDQRHPCADPGGARRALWPRGLRSPTGPSADCDSQLGLFSFSGREHW